MVESKLGTKHRCKSCRVKFYDLGKPVLSCPKCGADQKEMTDDDLPVAGHEEEVPEVDEVSEDDDVTEDEEPEEPREENDDVPDDDVPDDDVPDDDVPDDDVPDDDVPDDDVPDDDVPDDDDFELDNELEDPIV